ncbi:hypothetical protein Tco_0441335 [Tanacetum coccineum]
MLQMLNHSGRQSNSEVGCSNSTSQNFAFLSILLRITGAYYSMLAQPTTSPQLENEDFQQMDGDDLEELDLRWQVAMLTVRVKKKGHFARECRSGRNQGRRSYGDNGRSNAPTNESSSQALVAQDGLGGYDWSNDFEVEPVNYALMAISSSSSSSSSDSERNKINNLNLELEKVVKERDELKDKIVKWEESSKNLDELINSQMSARDKTGLGYGTQLNELGSNHETDSENSLSIFDVRSSDEENTPKNDRFSKNGYKAVPPPITGNFLTPRVDISFAGKTNDANTEKPKSVSELVVSNPKINRDRVVIEDWNSDDEEEEYEVPVKKTGKRRKQKARKGINIAKTAQDEFNNEREAFVKDKVKDALSESEIGVDAIPTATKPPTIVNWKIISQSTILKDFSRDDLIELYRLVIKKYGENKPEEMYDIVLWGDLKTMFDPSLSDDAIWSLPLQQKIINWKYYPTCAAHCLTLDASTIYMLVDRKYPLSKDDCQVMLKMKLLDGTMDTVCYQLLKIIKKQAGIRK